MLFLHLAREAWCWHPELKSKWIYKNPRVFKDTNIINWKYISEQYYNIGAEYLSHNVCNFNHNRTASDGE